MTTRSLGSPGGIAPGSAPRAVEPPLLAALRTIGIPALRIAVVAFPILIALLALATYSIFADPTTIGSDASNYYAAGLRLNAGHPLYALSPGDRNVPIVPPYWSTPLLAPPPIAVLWRVIALFGDVAMRFWWLGSMVSILGTVLLFARRATVPALVGMILISPALGLTAVSGNGNAFLLPLLICAWLFRDRAPLAAGAVVAIAAALKLSPALLAAWFLLRPEASGRRAFAGFLVAGAGIALVSLAAAGLDNHFAYLTAARDPANGAPTPLSIPGLLTATGVPGAIAGLSIPVLIVGALAIAARYRRNERLSFTVLAAAAALATPVVYFQTIALLAVALAPQLDRRGSAVAKKPVKATRTAPSIGAA